VLAFILPMEGVGDYNSRNCELAPYLTSVEMIEMVTALDFLTGLDDETAKQIEKVVHSRLWAE